MANFKTHVAIAAIASTGVAAFIAGLGTVTYGQAAVLAGLGLLGGILPDIDSDNSNAIDIVFNLVSTFFTGIAFLMTYEAYHPLVALIACVVTFIVVRFPVQWIFAKFTVHRGAFHSILAAFMMGLLFTVVADIMFETGEVIAWFAGLFVTLGYLVHLLLDEIYSVDFSNVRIKKSFGTAVKPLSMEYPVGSVVFAALAGGLYYLTPDIGPFIQLALDPTSVRAL